MQILLICLKCVLIFIPSFALYISNENSRFVKLVHDVKLNYQAQSVIIAMSNVYDYTKESFTSLVFTKDFSKRDIFTMIISLNELTEAIDWHEDRIVQPFHVILIKSYKDFEQFIVITRTRRINIYASLVIFETKNESLMDICKHPNKNYFNLVFDVKMLVMCHDKDIPIREWYSIFPNAVELVDFATWTYEGGLVKLTNKSMYKRRNSLKGISIRVTSVKNENGNESFEKQKRKNRYFSDIIDAVSEYSNFNIAFQKPENSYGIYNPITGKWNGVVEKLINNKTDIGLGEFSTTESRLNVIDFSEPIVISSSYFYVKRPDANILSWSMYYKAFAMRPAYILLSILSSVPLLIAYIIITNNKMNNKVKKSNSYLQIIDKCYLDVVSILCKMPLINFSGISSLRIAYLSLYILSFMLSSVYSAIIVSFLTNLKPDLPFNSLEEFMKDGSYKIAIIKDSNFAEEFYYSNNPTINKLKNFLIPYEELPLYVPTAIEQVCSGKKVVLFLDDYNVRSNRSTPSCDLVPFDQGFLVSNAFAFQKNSPYIKFFNKHLQKMRSTGTIQILKNRYMRLVRLDETNYESVTLWSAVPIFQILGFGILMSIIILIIEKIYFQMKIRRHKFSKSRTNYWKPLTRPAK